VTIGARDVEPDRLLHRAVVEVLGVRKGSRLSAAPAARWKDDGWGQWPGEVGFAMTKAAKTTRWQCKGGGVTFVASAGSVLFASRCGRAAGEYIFHGMTGDAGDAVSRMWKQFAFRRRGAAGAAAATASAGEREQHEGAAARVGGHQTRPT
jgi:hypothetical protein